MLREHRRLGRRRRTGQVALALATVLVAVAGLGRPADAQPSSPGRQSQEPAATCNGSVNHGLVDGSGQTYAGSQADPEGIVTLWRYQDNCLELRVCDTKPGVLGVTGSALDRVNARTYVQGSKTGDGTCGTFWASWAGNQGHLAVKACGGNGCRTHDLFLRSRAGTNGAAGYATAGQGNSSLRVCDTRNDNAFIAAVLLRPDGTAVAQLNDRDGGGCATARNFSWYTRSLRIRACVSDGDRAWDCQTRTLAYAPYIF
jgi:hypothetical protein